MLLTRRSVAIALTAASIIGSGVASVNVPVAEAAGSVKCFGINSCAGHGGNNACKGQGVVKTSRAKCLAAGGKIVG